MLLNLLTIFCSVFSFLNIFVYWSKMSLRSVSNCSFSNKLSLVQITAQCWLTTSHCLNHCWSSLLMHICLTWARCFEIVHGCFVLVFLVPGYSIVLIRPMWIIFHISQYCFTGTCASEVILMEMDKYNKYQIKTSLSVNRAHIFLWNLMWHNNLHCVIAITVSTNWLVTNSFLSVRNIFS